MHAHRGYSLVETLMVLGIIGLLLGLLLPAVHSARERARETVCKNNVYQINLAIVNFMAVHKKLPRQGRPGRVGGWIVDILPFIEQQSLQANIAVGQDVRQADESLHKPPAIFRCPRSSSLDATPVDQVWRGHYTLVTLQNRKFLGGIYDTPVDMEVPWLTGPELDYQQVLKMTGPHHGGFYNSSGGQQGISLMIDGRNVR